MRAKGSVAVLCRQYGITRHQFYHRMKSGWTGEETVGIVPRKKPSEADHALVNRVLREWRVVSA